MTSPSAERTFPTALSRDADSWFYNPEFIGVSHVFSNDLDDLMQDVPNLAFSNNTIESGTWFIPQFAHGLHATQLEPGQDSIQPLAPAQVPPNHASSFNKEAKSKSNTCTPVANIRLTSATNRVKGSARIGKTKKYPGSASASGIRKRARERKAHLLKGFALLEKAREALEPYSELPRDFAILLESSFSQLEKIVEEAICSDGMYNSSSTSESSNSEMDSAYGSFSDVSPSETTNSVHEEQNVNVERQTTGPTPSSIQDSEINPEEETPRLVQPSSPTYQCTYGPRGGRCQYSTSRKSDWIRHEESEKHWPQKRYMCMLCAEPQSDEDLNPCCTYCLSTFSSIEEVYRHSLNCIEARRKGKTFTGAKTDHFQAHLVEVHHRPGLDTISASWTYNHTTKWPRYCGFCTCHFKDWEERKHHVADHFKRGADILNWNPALHNPRRKSSDRPGFLPRSDDDDDDDDNDDDNWHQHGNGRYATEATQSAYTTVSSNSSSSYDPSNNSYLDWDNNEGGWGQYSIESKERCSNSLMSYVNIPWKNRLGTKRKNSGHGAYENEFTSDSYPTDDALSFNSTITVLRHSQGTIFVAADQTGISFIDGSETTPWIHPSESTTALEAIHDAYVRREDRSHYRTSPKKIRTKGALLRVMLNPERRRREYYNSCSHPSCSEELGRRSDWKQHWLNVNANGDRKPRFEYSCCQRCTECFIRKDNHSDHWISAQRQHFKDHLKSHHQIMAGDGEFLLSGTNKSRFDDHQFKLDLHVLAKGWKFSRVLKVYWSDQLHLPSGKHEDGSLLTSSDTISWGDKGSYIFDPSDCFLNNKRTCGPEQRLQEHFSGDKCCRKHMAIGHCCKSKFNCPKHQAFEDQRGLRHNLFLWECARSSRITEEQLAWIIRQNFKPFGITSNRPRYQKAKSGFPQSVALERYLSDYNRSEHLAYLASRHVRSDTSNDSNASIEALSFTCSGATLSLQVKQGERCCLFRLPTESNVGLTIDDLRAIVDGQDVDTHLILGSIKTFESGLATFPAEIDTGVMEECSEDVEGLESSTILAVGLSKI